MKKINFTKLFVAAFALAAVNTISAQDENGAAPCYDDTIYDFSQGLQTNAQPVAADRSNPQLALGEPSEMVPLPWTGFFQS